MELPRETTFHPQFEIIVSIDIEIAPSLRSKFEQFLSQVGENSSGELRFIREEYIRCRNSNMPGFMTLKLDYPVSLETLKANGGSIYLYEVDTVISLSTMGDAPPHPFSDAGVQARLAHESGFLGDDKKFSMQIEIVDNGGFIGDRFCNVLGQVYRLQPKKDPTRKDGVYKVGNTPASSESTRTELGSVFYPIEQAEETFRLYRSFEQAQDLGDEGTRQKREAAEAEQQLVKTKAELAQAKADIDKQALEIEAARQAMQVEFDEHQRRMTALREEEKTKIDFERMRQKDFYEERSYQRKDESEVMKHWPTIILGVGAFFMALGKFFASK